jgi:hypothetical protein
MHLCICSAVRLGTSDSVWLRTTAPAPPFHGHSCQGIFSVSGSIYLRRMTDDTGGSSVCAYASLEAVSQVVQRDLSEYWQDPASYFTSPGA